MPAVGRVKQRDVLVYTEGRRDDASAIVAVDPADRHELWREPLKAVSRTGVTIDGDLVAVGDREGRLYAYDLATGKPESWSPKTIGGGAIAVAPASAGGDVFVVAQNGSTGEVKVSAVDSTTGGQRWEFSPRLAAGTGSGVLVRNGRAYFGLGNEQRVHALTADDGVEVWATRTRSSFSPLASPAYADGRLYMTSTSAGDAALYSLDAADGGRNWDFQFQDASILSSPVVVGNIVYVGLDDGRVAGIDVGRGVEVWEDHTGPGQIGPLAVSGDELIASKRGRGGGLIAFGPNPGGRLLDIQSPSDLRLGHVLIDYAIALAAVLVVVVGAARGLRVVVGPPGAREPPPEGVPAASETTEGEPSAESGEED